jgi:transcription-repair coupling factor (superfamily II helicase)
VIYKRLANCNDDDELDNLQEELIDRFGLLPEQGEALMACHRLRVAAKADRILLKLTPADADSVTVQPQGRY